MRSYVHTKQDYLCISRLQGMTMHTEMLHHQVHALLLMLLLL